MLLLAATATIAILVLAETTVAQPLDDALALVRARTHVAVVDVFENALRPETVFRSKTLVEWAEQLRDADAEFRKAAEEAFKAMGDKAVPFLLRCGDVLDWEEVGFGHGPHPIIERMGRRSIEPLVNLLPTEHGVSAWRCLGRILDRHGLTIAEHNHYGTGPPAEWISTVRAEMKFALKTLEPCLGSGDAFTRYAGLNLLWSVAGYGFPQDWSHVVAAARRMMDGDERPEVRGAACSLLGHLGCQGVSGALTRDEIESICRDATKPRHVREAAVVQLLVWTSVDESENRPHPPKDGG